MEAIEILSKKCGMTLDDESAYIVHTKKEYILSAMEEYATLKLSESKQQQVSPSDEEMLDAIKQFWGSMSNTKEEAEIHDKPLRREAHYQFLLSKRNWLERFFNIQPDMSVWDMYNF